MASKEKSPVSDLLNRITGKESTLTIDLDNVGIDLGGEKKVTLTGRLNMSIVTLR